MNASNGSLVASIATDDPDAGSQLAEEVQAFKVGINKPRSRGDREEVFGGLGASWKGAFVGGDLLVQALTYGPVARTKSCMATSPAPRGCPLAKRGIEFRRRWRRSADAGAPTVPKTVVLHSALPRFRATLASRRRRDVTCSIESIHASLRLVSWARLRDSRDGHVRIRRRQRRGRLQALHNFDRPGHERRRSLSAGNRCHRPGAEGAATHQGDRGGPLTNQSGTGAKVTAGALTVTNATTASGYPAKAVAGYPADTIIWAIDDHGVAQRPDLVVSGINFGENIGPLASLSGTVGAAETALARGIPALAVSQGVDNGQTPAFSQGAKYLVAWVQAHRNALLAAKKGTAAKANGNLNVPTCVTGRIRGPVNVALGTTLTGYSVGTVDCSGTAAKPKTDVQAFVDGFASLTALHPVNPPQ